MRSQPWSTMFRRRPPAAPDGLRLYAIGDIHGRADLLAPLLGRIEADSKCHPEQRSITVFLGDYIDRGPASREVIDLLLSYGQTEEAVFLKGNHEIYVTRFLSDPSVLDDWRHLGGLETLCSYGLKPSISPSKTEQTRLADQFARALPAMHKEFFETLKLSFGCGDFLFVHAGIRPGIRIANQREEDLLWIREEFLASETKHEKFVVHGHTPVDRFDIRSNRMNLDTGAFATGRLTCAIVEGATITTIVVEQPLYPAMPDTGSEPYLSLSARSA